MSSGETPIAESGSRASGATPSPNSSRKVTTTTSTTISPQAQSGLGPAPD